MAKKEDQKNKGGRPPLYKTADDMQKIIDQYFSKCDELKEPYTMSGLAYELDMSRQTLIDYKNKDEFIDTIKKARLKVEVSVEKRMLASTGVVAGVIFNAKNNFGWRDKQEVEQKTIVSYEDMTDEQLEAAIKARKD